MIATKLAREFLEEQLCKLIPKRYSQFVWWRRYESRQTLPERSPLYDKIVNGDYNKINLMEKIYIINYFKKQIKSRYKTSTINYG